MLEMQLVPVINSLGLSETKAIISLIERNTEVDFLTWYKLIILL